MYETDTQPIVDKYNKLFESGKSTLDSQKQAKDTELNNQNLDIENKYKQLAEGIVRQREEGKKQYYSDRNVSDYNVAKETRNLNEMAGARNWRGGELIDINLKQGQKRTNALSDINTQENTYNKRLDTTLATGTTEYNTNKTNLAKSRTSVLNEYNASLTNLRSLNEAQKNEEIAKKINELNERRYKEELAQKQRESEKQLQEEKLANAKSNADRMYNVGNLGNTPQNSGTNIDKILTGYMAGKGNMILQAANKVGLDPALLAAIVMHETGGSSSAVRNQNNPGGNMGSNGLMTFNSLQEGLDFTARNIKNNYINQGRTTIPSIAAKYAPVGAENDPNNMNSDWVTGVSNFYNRAR